LREKGVTILLIEQNAKQALHISDYGIVLEQGQTRIEDTSQKFLPIRVSRSSFSVVVLRPWRRQREQTQNARRIDRRQHRDRCLRRSLPRHCCAGIEGFYHLMDADRLSIRRLPALLDAVKLAGFSGLNVTYPFKQEIIPLLDAIDPEAQEVGAVNTVVIDANQQTTGFNFDRRGWRNAFVEKFGADAAGAAVVLVGAGGAGRAVSCALMDLGVANPMIHDHDTKRAEASRPNSAHFSFAANFHLEKPRARHWFGRWRRQCDANRNARFSGKSGAVVSAQSEALGG
jgi:hypothetical protein